MNNPRYFWITFLGQPPENWAHWFDASVKLEIHHKKFILTGLVPDLAEFLGILARFQLLNLDPISMVYSLEPEETGLENQHREMI